MPAWETPRSRIAKLSADLPKQTPNLPAKAAVMGSMVTALWNLDLQEPGKGFEFESKIVGGVVPKSSSPIEAGIKAMENGTLAGFPVVDIKKLLL